MEPKYEVFTLQVAVREVHDGDTRFFLSLSNSKGETLSTVECGDLPQAMICLAANIKHHFWEPPKLI